MSQEYDRGLPILCYLSKEEARQNISAVFINNESEPYILIIIDDDVHLMSPISADAFLENKLISTYKFSSLEKFKNVYPIPESKWEFFPDLSKLKMKLQGIIKE